MPYQFSDSQSVMRRAVDLASRGVGYVEPNPAVGAVIVDDRLRVLGEGYHERFGGPHAEFNALNDARQRASESGHDAKLSFDQTTLFVTLEPCCHHGKTPPCTQAIIDAGIRKVVIGCEDPAPHADGKGIAELTSAGITVAVGLLVPEIRRLNAPFVKRVTTGMPYVHAKWAMTMDGKIATRSGASKWISNESSREIVHRLRGRMDAIIIGSGTVVADDPLLTARPPGPRTATRIVMDTDAKLSVDAQLVRTAGEAPVVVAVGQSAPRENMERLQAVGIEVIQLGRDQSDQSHQRSTDPDELLRELHRRDMTNVLVEGGGAVMGSFFAQELIDEIHVFIAPKLVGGAAAKSPIAGAGLETVPENPQVHELTVTTVGNDCYIHGYLKP